MEEYDLDWIDAKDFMALCDAWNNTSIPKKPSFNLDESDKTANNKFTKETNEKA